MSRRALDTALSWLGRTWSQLATAALGLLAWALLSAAAAALVHGPVWRISLGLLALSLFGWKFAFVIARDGIYTMTRPKRRSDG